MNKSSKQTDAYLVSLYLKGDENCLAELIKRHQERIFTYIYSKTLDRDLSNDLFQDTFIKVIHTLKRGKYNEEGKFLPWVLRIAHNLTMDFYRDRKRKNTKHSTENHDLFTFLASSDLNVEDQMELEQTLTDLTEFIEYLPKEQQEVLKMRIFMDMTFKEIAKQTDVSVNTSLGRMRYALINLRKILKQKEVFEK